MSEQEYREILWEKCKTMHIPNITREEKEAEEIEEATECMFYELKKLSKKYGNDIDIHAGQFEDIIYDCVRGNYPVEQAWEDLENELKLYVAE